MVREGSCCLPYVLCYFFYLLSFPTPPVKIVILVAAVRWQHDHFYTVSAPIERWTRIASFTACDHCHHLPPTIAPSPFLSLPISSSPVYSLPPWFCPTDQHPTALISQHSHSHPPCSFPSLFLQYSCVYSKEKIVHI
jgi:hypothetical protein